MGRFQQIRVNGKVYRLAVFRVESRDEQGRPEHLTYVPDDRTVELSQNPDENHFVFAFASVEGFGPNGGVA